MIEGDLTSGGKHRMQYTDVLWNCTLETYKILLTKVTPIYFIIKHKA